MCWRARSAAHFPLPLFNILRILYSHSQCNTATWPHLSLHIRALNTQQPWWPTFPRQVCYCMTSGFCREVDEVCALLGFYAAHSGNSLPTYQDNLSVPSSGVKKSVIYRHLKRGPIVCTETAVRDCCVITQVSPRSELDILVCRSFANCISHPTENCRMITNADSRRMWPESVVGCSQLRWQYCRQAETKHPEVSAALWTIVSQVWSKGTGTNSETFSEYTGIVKAKCRGLDVRGSISDDVLLTLFHLTQYSGYNHGMTAQTVWHPLSHLFDGYRWLFPIGKMVGA